MIKKYTAPVYAVYIPKMQYITVRDGGFLLFCETAKCDKIHMFEFAFLFNLLICSNLSGSDDHQEI